MVNFPSNIQIRYENLKDYYFGGPIIVDTCLMLLILEGSYNLDKIGISRLNSRYTKEDFTKLINFVSKFKTIAITPHVLAEISNLVNGKISDKSFSEYISSFSKRLVQTKEIFINKDQILKNEDLLKVGVTDVSLLASSLNEDIPIITDDLKFFNISAARGASVINFNQIRYP